MTWAILILTIGVSILAFQQEDLLRKLRFSPWLIRERGQGYRFLSYAIVHADWMHLGINMFVLYSFGMAVEHYYRLLFTNMSWFYFILLYVGGVVLSVTPAFGKHSKNPQYAAVGASGAVSAVVFASIIIRPMSGIMIFPLPFEIPGILFGGLYLIYSAWMSRRGNDNVGHDAHLWGAVYGSVFTIALKPSLLEAMVRQIL
ncbi:MAG: rhomboid family intramembrane serine protease [Bacteroidales bacterium]|nr:rhomboid family intramembrane serine protease [Bacteroidales bacterium]